MKGRIVKVPYFATVWFIASLVRGLDLALVLLGTVVLYALDMALGHYMPSYAEVTEDIEDKKEQSQTKQPDQRLVS